MKKRKNLSVDEVIEDVEIEVDHSGDPSEMPLWYKQFMGLNETQRARIADSALKRLKETKPEAYDFIRKFKCELVGLQPNVSYALINKADGETDVTWVHGFALPTLLYWCKSGGFGFFINANLDYNDTVLNRVKGNKIDKAIRGFTS